LLSAEKKLKF